MSQCRFHPSSNLSRLNDVKLGRVIWDQRWRLNYHRQKPLMRKQHYLSQMKLFWWKLIYGKCSISRLHHEEALSSLLSPSPSPITSVLSLTQSHRKSKREDSAFHTFYRKGNRSNEVARIDSRQDCQKQCLLWEPLTFLFGSCCSLIPISISLFLCISPTLSFSLSLSISLFLSPHCFLLPLLPWPNPLPCSLFLNKGLWGGSDLGWGSGNLGSEQRFSCPQLGKGWVAFRGWAGERL